MSTEASNRLGGADFAFPGLLTQVERENAPTPRFSLLGDMIVSRGDRSDWDRLKDLHYKETSLPLGPHFFKLTLGGETIGVLITSNPKGLLKERHAIFPNLRPASGETNATNTHRYNFVNANFRVVSRFVIDTMYRGIGAGYRMMNLVARMEGTPFMEIQSSMSKFNFFGQRAGFRFVEPRNALKFEAGMRFFRSHFEASPQDFEAIVAEIEAMPAASRERTLDACRLWYFRNSPQEKTGPNKLNTVETRVAGLPTRALIKNMQQIVLSSPMYGIRRATDAGRPMPATLPLTAFDLQPPNDPARF